MYTFMNTFLLLLEMVLLLLIEEYGTTLETLPKVLTYGLPKNIKNDQWPLSLPFVVISPQMHGKWVGVHEFGGLLKEFPNKYGDKIDYTRIYITGISAGGYSTYYVASKWVNSIAAIVPIVPGNYDSKWTNTIASANLPIWNFLNQNDSLAKFAIDATKELNDAGIKPKTELTIYPSANHDAWTATYNTNNNQNDIYSWMLKWTNKRTHVNQSPTPSPTVSPKPTQTPSPTPSPTLSSGTSWNKKQRPTFGYWEFFPSISTKGKYPLLINFHGSDSFGSGSDSDLNNLLDNSIPYYINNKQWPDTYPFLVICPQTKNSNPYWDNSPAVFDDILNTYEDVIDTTKIYIIGQGRGANGIVNLFKNNPNRSNKITAIVPIRIYSNVENSTADSIVQSKVFNLWIRNNDDPYSLPSYTQSWVDYLSEMKANPTQYFKDKGGAEYNSKYNPLNPSSSNIYSWLLSKSK
eukprot:gene6054-7541_t